MRVRFTEIDWETDGKLLEQCGLPTECTLDLDDELARNFDTIDQYLEEEEAATLLSDRFGFLVNGCKFEVLKVVTVTVEGGVVQHVQCPPGVRVIVKDYDVDGSETDLHEDENGDKYNESIWE